jgi:pectinesterase
LVGKVLNYLGKPCRPYSKVVFSNPYMDEIIFPEGWIEWNVLQSGETQKKK